jgi:hypothetical protein
MHWAWTVRLQPAPKLVLMALADEADDRGFCFPSVRHLAHKCSISERSVQRIVRLLVARAYVSIQQRFRKDRARTSNGYQLAIDPTPTIRHRDPDSPVANPATSASPGARQIRQEVPDIGVVVTTTERLTEPKLHPPPSPIGGLVAEVLHRGGGELCFPKDLTRGQRNAISHQLNDLTTEVGQQILDELAGRMSATLVANPIRYCAALVQRLKVGEFNPELGVAVAERRAAHRQYEARLNRPPGASETATKEQLDHLPDEVRASLERMRPRRDEASINEEKTGGQLSESQGEGFAD